MSQPIPLKTNDSMADLDVEASVEKTATQAVRTHAVSAMLAIQKRSQLTPSHWLWKKVYKSFQVSD
jgi:hypothetical protein